MRPTVGGAGGFEERRRGQRFKLALAVQLSDGIGITCDISTSGILRWLKRAQFFRPDGNWFKSCATVNKRDKSRIKGSGLKPDMRERPGRVREQSFSLVQVCEVTNV